MDDILSRIRKKYDSFTKAEKRVADYVLSNPQKVVYQSINDLAEEVGVGETSVFRFCRDLDQKGYQDFKMHVAQAIAASSEEAAATQLTGAVSFRDSLEDVVKKVLSSNMEALQETFKSVHLKDLEKAVKWMVEAGKIHFFGVGGSMVTAVEAKSRFIRITPKVHLSEDLHLQLMEASLMTENDVALLFSYSGATKDTIDIAARAKEGGAKLIAITRHGKSTLSRMCDIVLLCGANEGPLQGGSMAVKMSQFFLLDVLYLEYFKQTYEVSTANRAKTAAAVSDKIQ